MYIAKREELRRRREELGVTKFKLSKEAGLPNNAVWRMENEDYRTHPLRAKAIAGALHCEVSDIFTDEKELPA